MEDDSEVFVPAVPHIGKTIGRSGDQVYRAMEDSSAANAEAVSAITGEDASNMKITNMADYLRPGDQAAKMSTSAVALNKGQGGFLPLMGQTGAQFARHRKWCLSPHRRANPAIPVRGPHRPC